MKTNSYSLMFLIFVFGCLLLLIPQSGKSEETIYQVGVARVDVTPDYPIRLNGYLARTNECEGITQHVFGKALAFGSDKDGPAILITLDNCIIPAWLREELLHRLAKKKITSDKFVIGTSHTHCAPKIAGAADNIFGMDIPANELAHIDRYSKELTDNLEKVVLAALKDRKPAKLSWGKTAAYFAANRRTKGGPVDNEVPVLKVTDKNGRIRALLVNYACHCTTMGPYPNKICADWAGYAQEYLERDNPGAIAMTIMGCGADANPQPRGTLENTKDHGQSIATAVGNLLSQNKFTPLNAKLEFRTKAIALDFDTIPTRDEFAKTASDTNLHFAIRYAAKKNLERLDRGEKLPTHLPYLVQTWNFGDQLAMVFLNGEVVVDYELRLKREFYPERLWVNGYANSVPCYIPSKRIWHEGGYEGGGAMIYYDLPTRLAENTEEKIIGAVHDIMPKSFLFDEKKAEFEKHKLEFPDPKSTEEALKTFHTKPGFEVDLVASEPQIVDPVAIDFATDGKLWVCEMHDYPSGMDGHFKVPGGRVMLLEDKNHDGKFEKSTVFLDGLTFPTGLMQWRKGVLICAAPDILYAEDTNGDGKADVVKKLFTGFATHNFQARVNSLRWGLDNWVYGSGGLFGGKIHSEITGQDIEATGRDFRFNPDTGEMQSSSGVSQQGRVRDDFGDWFGCNNSMLLIHFPLPEKYLRRNLNFAAPDPSINVYGDPDPNALFPISYTLERFNVPNSANHTTSACGVEIYRDDLLGENYYGNSFVCEPVHNLVHRYLLENKGVTFAAHRPEDEQTTEFLASSDNWFRPVETRTGPDGALWIVDMYRFVIEHPMWISAERLAKLDVRAGDNKGRIYRVFPKSEKLQPLQNLTKIKTAKLVALLETSNGTERDLIHRELYQRDNVPPGSIQQKADRAAIEPLKKIAATTKNPAVKIQALSALEGLNTLSAELVIAALKDSDEHVRENAIRLSEPFLRANDSAVGEALLQLANDPEYRVRFQLALSFGEWNDPRAGKFLGEMAKKNLGDALLRAAILSSATPFPGEILKEVLTLSPETPGRNEAVGALIATASDSKNPQAFETTLMAIAPENGNTISSSQFAAMTSLQEALQRKNISLDSFANSFNEKLREAVAAIRSSIGGAGAIASDKNAPLASREAAVGLLSWSNDESALRTLIALATQTENAKLQNAAQNSLRLQKNAKLPELLLAGWTSYPIPVRSGILEILLGRDEGMKKVLDGIEQGLIKSAEVPIAKRQALLKHADEKVRDRATALFPQNQDRAKVLAKFSGVSNLSGEAERGAQVFAKLCVSCHAFKGQGVGVGPDLMALGDKSPQDFMLAILDPSSAIEPRFIQYNIETKDGRSLSGIIRAETAASVTLVQGGGVQEKILRSDISEMRASNLSLMPEGMEEGTSSQDFADLIAYLKARPARFGSATAEQAEAARKKFADGGANGFVQLVSSFDNLEYPSWMGKLPMPYCRQTDGTGKVIWKSAPAPKELKADAFYDFRLAAGMGLISQKSGKFTLNVNGKSELDFTITLSDATWHSKDGKVLMSYHVMENSSEDSNGILTISLRGDLLKANKPIEFAVIGSATSSQRWFGIYSLPETRTAKVHAVLH